ncbi:MAG: ABC transporter ATP-binding protein [Rhodothermaceae bacterium]|nr:ABC transporter ATP-binding protein [Rhodothermaceae bacterium]
MDAVNDGNKASVQLNEVTKRFGDLVAVNSVSIEIQGGEFFSLLGPSGCGKTTLLRSIAGFETIDSGSISINKEEITHLSPQQRPTAMVFQNYALFPTMTVEENVSYGLQVKKVAKDQIRRRVSESLERVDLAGMGRKPVTQLSGGQQQRVALARAMAVRPNVLLFDEPLSNLDVALREQTRRELKLLQDELKVTSIYVTHDQQEALALSDRIAVMRSGALQQVGTPESLYRYPETAFVAQFLGGSNIIKDEKVAHVLTRGEERPSEKHVLSVRPEHLRFSGEGGVDMVVKSRLFLGTSVEWWLQAGGQTLRAWLPSEVEYGEGDTLIATEFRWVLADD